MGETHSVIFTPAITNLATVATGVVVLKMAVATKSKASSNLIIFTFKLKLEH